MESMLDALIENAKHLNSCEEQNGQCAELEYKQEALLNQLLKMNNELDQPLVVEKAPQQYSSLEKKLVKLSEANRKLLRTSCVRKRRRSNTKQDF